MKRHSGSFHQPLLAGATLVLLLAFQFLPCSAEAQAPMVCDRVHGQPQLHQGSGRCDGPVNLSVTLFPGRLTIYYSTRALYSPVLNLRQWAIESQMYLHEESPWYRTQDGSYVDLAYNTMATRPALAGTYTAVDGRLSGYISPTPDVARHYEVAQTAGDNFSKNQLHTFTRYEENRYLITSSHNHVTGERTTYDWRPSLTGAGTITFPGGERITITSTTSLITFTSTTGEKAEIYLNDNRQVTKISTSSGATTLSETSYAYYPGTDLLKSQATSTEHSNYYYDKTTPPSEESPTSPRLIRVTSWKRSSNSAQWSSPFSERIVRHFVNDLGHVDLYTADGRVVTEIFREGHLVEQRIAFVGYANQFVNQTAYAWELIPNCKRTQTATCRRLVSTKSRDEEVTYTYHTNNPRLMIVMESRSAAGQMIARTEFNRDVLYGSVASIKAFSFPNGEDPVPTSEAYFSRASTFPFTVSRIWDKHNETDTVLTYSGAGAYAVEEKLKGIPIRRTSYRSNRLERIENLIAPTNARFMQIKVRDEEGRITAFATPEGDTTLTYDPSGLAVTVRSPIGTEHVERYGENGALRERSVTFPSAATYTTTYHEVLTDSGGVSSTSQTIKSPRLELKSVLSFDEDSNITSRLLNGIELQRR